MTNFIIALMFILFALGLEGQFFGFPTYLTFKRVGLLILIYLFIIEKSKTIRSDVFYTSLFFIITITAIYILHVVFKGNTFLTRPVAWYLICIALVIFSSFDLPRLLNINVLNNITIISLIIISYIIVYSFIYHSIYSLYVLRYTVDLYLGLNRFLNGFAFLLIILSVYYYKKGKNINKQYVFFIFTFIFISIITGSRQSMLTGILIFLPFLFKKKNGSIYLLIIIISGLYLITQEELIFNRIIKTSSEQFEYGSNRFDILENSILSLSKNLFIGLGPGEFYSEYGYFSHNGFLTTALDFGVSILMIIFALQLYILVIIFKNKKFYLINYIFCINLIAMLNDVLHEYIYFITLYIIYRYAKNDYTRAK